MFPELVLGSSTLNRIFGNEKYFGLAMVWAPVHNATKYGTDDLLYRSARGSFAPLQKSRQTHRSHM